VVNGRKFINFLRDSRRKR